MKHVVFPAGPERTLVFYLAAEEYVAAAYGEGFFIWSVPPTVIFGRNQDMAAEVNIPFCEANGIRMFRRKSGGGCVYADEGNIMLSFITAKGAVAEVFAEYIDSLCVFLRSIGVDAVSSSRNDVMVQDRKVSGNAFFSAKDASIVHGTLLYDEDLEAMQKAITPPVSKLERHGVQSVRQRVMNLRPQLGNLSRAELEKRIIDHFTDGALELSEEDVAQICRIEESYVDKSFIEGRR